MFESLESRQLFSADLAWVPAYASGSAGSFATIGGTTTTLVIQTSMHVTKTGTLVIKGTDAADKLSVIRDGNTIHYQTKNGDNLSNFFTDASKVKRVLVEAGSGDDRVFIDPGLDKPCTVVGGSGNDRIDGNYGSMLIGGTGNDRLFASPSVPVKVGSFRGFTFVGASGVNGTAVLSGGAGNDTLIGSDGDDFVGGAGHDTGLLYLPNADPKTFVTDGKLGGKSLSEYFTSASGLERYEGQVGTGKDSVFTSVPIFAVTGGTLIPG